MKNIKMIHLAAQYLAAAGISFLDKKDDDSHTNLGFDAQKGYLETWPINEDGCKIAFDYAQFSLHWVTNNTNYMTLQLDGKSHSEIVQWMDEVVAMLGGTKAYSYNLHYELPYDKVTDDFIYSKPLQRELNQSLEYRKMTHRVMENVVDKMNFNTTIRIWPHHFDSGGYETINSNKKIGIGFGLAIPDAMMDDYYLYTSGYIDHDGVDTSKFEKLTNGEWMNEGFKGAVLPMKNIDEAKAIIFFNESIRKYKSL